MKKQTLSLSIALLLSACGGGSSGSSDTPKPPVTVPDEVIIAAMSDSFGFDVSTICSDPDFLCGLTDPTKAGESSATIQTKDYFLSADTYGDEFTNYSELLYPFSYEVESLATPIRTSHLLKVIVDGETIEEINFSTLDVSILSESKQIAVELFNDVQFVDQADLLAVLSDPTNESIIIEDTASIALKNGQNLELGSITKNLSADSYKSFFTMLQVKHDQLYKPDPEADNNAPTLEVIGSLEVNAGETAQVQVIADDQDGDSVVVNTMVENVPNVVIDINEDGSLVTVTPDVDHAGGEYSITFTATDEHGLSTSVVKPLVVKPLVEPETTLEEFAQLIGEPVDKLEILFSDSSVDWFVKNGEPWIVTGFPHTTMLEFNLANKDFGFFGAAHISNSEFKESTGRNIKFIVDARLAGTYEINFDMFSIEKIDSSMHVSANGSFNDELVSTLFAADSSNSFIELSYEYKDTLTGELAIDEIIYNTAPNHESLRNYLREILTK